MHDEMNALGRFIQIAEIVVLQGAEASMLPSNANPREVAEVCNALIGQALPVVKRARSPTAARLLVVPFLADLSSFHSLRYSELAGNPCSITTTQPLRSPESIDDPRWWMLLTLSAALLGIVHRAFFELQNLFIKP
jgi:hypothetical protein